MKVSKLLFLSLAIILVSCSKKKEGVEIYNPYDYQLEVSVGDEKHQITSQNSFTFKGEAGEYKV